MVLINYTVREISTKIVYYGPGLSGKTTNIQNIHTRINPESRGKLVSLATETDRTLFFDFFPIDFGTIGGFKVRFHFYTVPGQVFYNSTRKLVLKGADGVVFVADSQRSMSDSNIDSLINLKENLAEIDIDLDDFPFVIQYNKRDLPDLLSIEEMQKELNPRNVPYYEACALKGDGIMETMKAISKIALQKISDQKGLSKKKTAKEAAPAATQEPDKTPTEKVKEAIANVKAHKEDKDLRAPATPPEPPKPEAKPKPEAAEKAPPAPQPEPRPVEKKKEAAKPTEAPAATAESVNIRFHSLEESIAREIVLPDNFKDNANIPLTLPVVLEIPKYLSAYKLNLSISASYVDKNGRPVTQQVEAKGSKRKNKGLFGWRK